MWRALQAHALWQFISHLDRSPTVRQALARQEYKPGGFAAPLGEKDIRLTLAAAEALRVPMPLASLVHDRLQTAAENSSIGPPSASSPRMTPVCGDGSSRGLIALNLPSPRAGSVKGRDNDECRRGPQNYFRFEASRDGARTGSAAVLAAASTIATIPWRIGSGSISQWSITSAREAAFWTQSAK